MEGYHLSFTSSPFLVYFFLFVLCLPLLTLGDDPCEKAICGKGTCVPSNSTFVGYDCSCDPGWKKFGLGFACVVPDCTLNLSCGSGAPSPPPPPPPPPPPSLLPPINLCGLVWCGEGTCVVNGTLGYYCQCNEGSTNLLNLTAFPCIKKCSLGVDCNNVLLSNATPPPPPSNGTLRIESPPRSPPNGSDKVWKRYWSSSMVLLSTIILVWIMYE